MTKASSQMSSPPAAHRPNAPLEPWRASTRSIASRTRSSTPVSSAELLRRGEPVDVEQRHGAADDLLGAAVGIAVERRSRPARRARRAARPRPTTEPVPGNRSAHEIARDSVRLAARLERAHRAAHERRRCPAGRASAKRLRQRRRPAPSAARRAARAGAGRGHRDRRPPLALASSRTVLRSALAPATTTGPWMSRSTRVVARRPFDIVEVDAKSRLVADEQEARQGRRRRRRDRARSRRPWRCRPCPSTRRPPSRRTVPLKAGMSKVTVAAPSAPTLTTPE